MPSATPQPSELLTCSAIAERIAIRRGSCNRASVWRIIQRLQIHPALKAGNYSLYTVDDAETIESSMRVHKAKDSSAQA